MIAAPPPAPPIGRTGIDAIIETFLHSIRIPRPLLVAISGGSDSTALLVAHHRALTRIRLPGLSLHAATVDHGLRPGSADEARQVAALCARLGVPHSTLVWQGDKPVTGIQQAARLARYRLLSEEAGRLGGALILTGHTADDQHETIAMRAARGEGRGLSGMAEAVLIRERIWACRPLLGASRATLRDLLAAEGLGWIDDPSNENRAFERVRIRTEERPPTEAASLSATGRKRESVLQAQWLAECVTVRGGAVAFVPSEKLGDVSGAASGALILMVMALGGKVHRPPAVQVTAAVDWVRSATLSRRTLAGTVLDRRREGLYLYREARGLVETRLREGDRLDGRYRAAGFGDAILSAGPVNDIAAEADRLERAGVTAPIARRAAPGAMMLAGPVPPGARLEPLIAQHADFLPGFDLAVQAALRNLFGLPALPDHPLRESASV